MNVSFYGHVRQYHNVKAEIDAHIAATSHAWRLERMDRVDRNVVRIAAAELAARPDVPRPVVLQNRPRFTDLAPGTRIRDRLGLADALPLVLYQGGLQPGRGLEDLVAAQTALAPVPQASVMPLPRSHVRMRTSSREMTCAK